MQMKKKSVKSKQIDNKGKLSPVARKKREETLKKKLGARWKTMSPQHKNKLINTKAVSENKEYGYGDVVYDKSGKSTLKNYIPPKSTRGNAVPIKYRKKVKN
tara:strand:- start:62 stop:367 length:306 start_codon:yes stop_codon:yes gene_type:complete